jgi:general secretion pathway protein D
MMKKINRAMRRISPRLFLGTLIAATALRPSQVSAQDDFGGGDFGNSSGATSGAAGAASSEDKQTNTKVLSKAKQSLMAQAGLEEITNENFPETIESFDFPNVEITDIIKAISELTGKNFIIDPGVRGKITIVAPSKITVAEAYKAFLSALAINGFTVVPSGSFLKVKNARNAQRDNIETYTGAYYPNSDQMITRIIHLKHIQAVQVNRDLRILTSKDGDVAVYEPTNSLIISDYGSNIDRIMKILSQLDLPGFEEQLEVIRIRHAKAKDLAELVDKIVNKGQGGGNRSGGTFSSGVPRFSRSGTGTSSQQGASYFMAIPDERTNSIIAVGNKSGILRIKKLLSQLDFKLNPDDSGGIFVYYTKFGEAKKIAQVLTGVAKDAAPKNAIPGAGGAPGLSPFPSTGFGGPTQSPQSTTPAGGELFGGDVKITADETTNSLVITASKQDYEIVLNLLAKIDIPRDQVFVEAVIMEMNMVDNNSWGSGYYQYGSSGFGRGGYNTGVDVSQILNPLPGGEGSPLILPFSMGKSVKMTNPASPGNPIEVPSLVAFFQLLTINKRTNILSTPKILALDNQEAEIEVGDKVITGVTTTASAAGATQASPNFENATIKLKIKPFISPASNSIRMEVQQDIKQPNNNLKPPKALQDLALSLSSRTIKTQIVVTNGDTAILGGLIKDTDTETVNKVPLLGDLPIIGWLFKGRQITKDKVNLLVFLTPKIVRSPRETKEILDTNLEERLEYVKEAGGKDPYGKKVDQIQKRTALLKGSTDSATPVPQGTDLKSTPETIAPPPPEISPSPTSSDDDIEQLLQ